MFRFLKRDPARKLRKQYEAKLSQAMLAQRNGDIRRYSDLTAEAEALLAELNALEETSGSGQSS